MSKLRSAAAVAMFRRYGKTKSVHKDRRERRPKDARNHWSKNTGD